MNKKIYKKSKNRSILKNKRFSYYHMRLASKVEEKITADGNNPLMEINQGKPVA